MKKTALSLALAFGLVGAANADPIVFDASSFSAGTIINFDYIDFSSETASVTQTDTSGDGTVAGNDSFIELGGTYVGDFKYLGASSLEYSLALNDFRVYFDYSINGTASVVGNELTLNFSSFNYAELFVLYDSNNTNNDAGAFSSYEGANALGYDTKYTLMDFNLNGGNCNLAVNTLNSGTPLDPTDDTIQVDTSTGHSCDLSFDPINIANNFTWKGLDLSSLPLNSINLDYTAVIDNFVGLNVFYPDGEGSDQTFNVDHDAFMNFAVPEPGMLAVFGVSLIGLGGLARRRKN